MNNDTTPCESMVQLPPHDLCAHPSADTTKVILPGSLLPPTPIVLQGAPRVCDVCGDKDNPETCHCAGVGSNPDTGRNECLSCHSAWLVADLEKWLPPRTLQRQASDVAFMSPEVLREKLRKVNYVEPILPRTCAIDGCGRLTHQLICEECETQIESLERQAEMKRRAKEAREAALKLKARRAFWPLFAIVVVVMGVLIFLWMWQAGWLP